MCYLLFYIVFKLKVKIWFKVLIFKIILDKIIFVCLEFFFWYRGYGGVILKCVVILNIIELRNVKEVRGNYLV